MLVTTISFAGDSGAVAQAFELGADSQELNIDTESGSDQANTGPVFVSEPVIQALPEAPKPANAANLRELVLAMPQEVQFSDDLQCLAGAVYFESRGEPLEGQLAVARVVVNRAESDRFPESYCDVVYQKSQFSFVRSGRMPSIATTSEAWRNAKAVAQIAHEGLWESPAEEALFFHATYVNPGWRKQRLAKVSRHVFYR
jgi:spore germination cell wall hydrolase CwlJ-like protein